MQCIVVKSDEFENSLPLYIFPLNPDYVAARSLRSLRSNKTYTSFDKGNNCYNCYSYCPARLGNKYHMPYLFLKNGQCFFSLGDYNPGYRENCMDVKF